MKQARAMNDSVTTATIPMRAEAFKPDEELAPEEDKVVGSDVCVAEAEESIDGGVVLDVADKLEE
jgi:hypothetical protein